MRPKGRCTGANGKQNPLTAKRGRVSGSGGTGPSGGGTGHGGLGTSAPGGEGTAAPNDREIVPSGGGIGLGDGIDAQRSCKNDEINLAYGLALSELMGDIV